MIPIQIEALFDQQEDYKNETTFQDGKTKSMKSKRLPAKTFKPSEPKQFKNSWTQGVWVADQNMFSQ